MRAKILRAAALCPLVLALPQSPPMRAGLPNPAFRDARLDGHLTLLDKGDRQAEDVAQAVIWLVGDRRAPVTPARVDISTADKEFSPHIMVVPLGTTVTFDNHDSFDHNVFSQSEENPFDLGMYGRGETRSVRFDRAGIVRVYCNVHAQMSALVVVRDNPWYAQPSGDGSFSIAAVPPGRYVLHAWHERASETTRALTVPAEGSDSVALELDARGYKFKPHLNKFGRPYPQQGRRY